MAHTYLITRGIKHEVDEFIKQLQGKYLPCRAPLMDPNTGKVIRDAKGNLTMRDDGLLQLGVRPIQLWEIVYPYEHQDVVLSTLLAGNSGKPQQKWQEKYVWALQKALKLNPIPPYNNANKLPVRCAGIELVGIGTKRDYYITSEDKHISAEEYDKLSDEEKKKCYEGI